MRNRVRQIRKDKGMSQLQLATEIGVSRAYITQIETYTRQLNAKMLESIAAVFGVHPRDLIDAPEMPSDIREHISLLMSLPQTKREEIFRFGQYVHDANAVA